MTTSPVLTAEQFAAKRADLPDEGRWTELVAGEVLCLSAPEPAHGTLVLNLSKAVGEHIQANPDSAGYACFELGLVVARRPDTVRCPAISFFRGRSTFDEWEHTITDVRPALVVEVASGNTRRRDMAQRVQGYRDWGLGLLWVVDTHLGQVHVYEAGSLPKQLSDKDDLSGGRVLPGFTAGIAALLAEPKWWKG